MALLTDAELTAIKNRSEIAGVQHRLSTSTARCTVCKNPWPCKKAMEYESDFSLEDNDLLLADREERTRLLREAERYLDHRGCGYRRLPDTVKYDNDPCSCGLDALLDEIREAVKE